MARRKKSSVKRKRTFWGDRVLCGYILLTCCCVPGWISAGAKQEPEYPIQESTRELLADSRIADFLGRPDTGLLLAVPVAILSIGWLWVLFSLWRSRLWTLWLLLMLYLPSAVYAAWARDWITAATAAAIVIYCLLRVFHAVGPRG